MLATSPFPSASRTSPSEITPTYSSAGVRVSPGMCSGGEPTGSGRVRRTSCVPPVFAAYKEVGGILSGWSANWNLGQIPSWRANFLFARHSTGHAAIDKTLRLLILAFGHFGAELSAGRGRMKDFGSRVSPRETDPLPDSDARTSRRLPMITSAMKVNSHASECATPHWVLTTG